MKKLVLITAIFTLGGILFFTGCQQTAVTSAKVYMQQSNFDKAIEQCKLAIAQAPNDPDAYFILGQSYGEKSMYRDMNQAFNKSLSISSKYTAAIEEYKTKYYTQLFNSGVSLIKQAKFEEAVNNYQICIEIFPKKMDSYKNLGYIYSQMKKDTAAIEVYKKASKEDSTDMETRSALGILYYRTKQYENAIAALKPVIAKSKTDSKTYLDALYYTAYSYDLLQQTEKAIETYTNALKATPDNKDLIFNLGRLYITKSDYTKASEHFAKVLAMDPNDFDANFNTGFCLLQQKKYDESLPALKKSVELKPDNLSAWANLVVSLDQSSKKDYESYYLIGSGLLQLNKPKDAISYLRKSIDLKQDNASAWEKLGAALDQSGSAKESQEALKKAAALKGGK